MHAIDRPPPDADTLSGWPPEPVGVRIRDVGEIAAALPHLLGFRPRESVVLLSLGGASGGRVGLTVRADIPPPEHDAELARGPVRGAVHRPARGALLLVVSEAADDDVVGRRAVCRTATWSGRWCRALARTACRSVTRCSSATAGGGPTTVPTAAARRAPGRRCRQA